MAARRERRVILPGAAPQIFLGLRTAVPYAVIGAVSATVLWEITRHVLVWYFGTLSQVSVVYGSLTTSIVVLASLDMAATLLLLGAQVIAEYERIGTQGEHAAPRPLRT